MNRRTGFVVGVLTCTMGAVAGLVLSRRVPPPSSTPPHLKAAPAEMPAGRPMLASGSRTMQPATTEPLRSSPAARPPLSTRPDVALVRDRRSAGTSCAATQGVWRLDTGEVVTLEPGGRGTWQEARTGRVSDVRWLCHVSGKIEVETPQGTMQLTSDDGGKTLTGTGPRGGSLEARR